MSLKHSKYSGVFPAVCAQDPFREGPGPPFWFHFGYLWCTCGHLGPPLAPRMAFSGTQNPHIFSPNFGVWPGVPREVGTDGGSLVTLLVTLKLTFAPKAELSCESCALLGFLDFLFRLRKRLPTVICFLGGTLRQIH